MLNRGARLYLACADAFQLRRRVIADFAIGHHHVANRGRSARKSGRARRTRPARALHGLALEYLPHGVGISASEATSRSSGEPAPTRVPRFAPATDRIGERAESKIRTRAQVVHGLADQFEFGSSAAVSCRGSRAWMTRLPGTHVVERLTISFSVSNSEALLRGVTQVPHE